MSLYSQFEIERLREKNAAALRELGKMRAERDEAIGELAKMREAQAATSARAERLGSMLDLVNSAMAAVNEVARKVIAERDAALARAADSDARLVRAIDAAKAAALAALTAPSPAGRLDARMVDGVRVETRGFEQLNPDDYLFFDAAEGDEAFSLELHPRPCPLCDDIVDDGLDCGDGLDTARKGRVTPSVRR